MKLTPFILMFSTLASAITGFADVVQPKMTEKPQYLLEAKITEESQSANNTQKILSSPHLVLSQDSGGTISMIENLPIGDLADKPSPGIIFQAWLKSHEGTPYLSVKTTICKVVDNAKAAEVAWITTQSTDTWICAKLDVLPKIINIPNLTINGNNYSVEIKVTQVDPHRKK